ncbi:succinylglutamate desuccinylase/aspartoacylase family protein [Leeuwenhoekiella nanhaiensis]|uniref:Succinylglutamate desuccinylase n=1 Tax=Leeuwenhoekiella nanhaiensis TaxID=1655491 RepID=A0A2G1VSI9_9FLAO|nr:succinylglutamate desuccinylase/aspartoacylase family protein [Leeuwenhoekiella nanhaiensis]PHQ29711.1 succinylglutamate desuccinylase [Leeuwenhoekiella nanhaiensis]
MTGFDEKNVLHILGEKIPPGAKRTLNFNLAKLYTTTSVEVPIIIQRSKKPGPCILITAGIHGDEINGVEIVRQVISKKINKPARGTIVCIPVINVFGFLNMDRAFPDGRDLNRVFPGTRNGSLASRFAYQFTNKILPIADFCLDFHTGGGSRFNVAQIRVDPEKEELLKYAQIFGAPFIVYSKNITKSYRSTCEKMNIPILLFEGGKSQISDKDIARAGVHGVIRILHHFKMLSKEHQPPEADGKKVVTIKSSTWLRAKYSGLLHLKITCGDFVEKNEVIATITDPYGSFRHKVKAPNDGYIINTNEASLVYQGDAIFHLSTALAEDEE